MNQRVAVVVLCCGLLTTAGEPLLSQPAPAPQVRFDRDVLPIFASKCMKCHGSDKAEGGLRLTDRASAFRELDSGELAIVPSQPEASELLRRVASHDDDDRMPPEGARLTAGQVESLRQWIADGADWPEHWAYRPLVRPPVPQLPADAARTVNRDWPQTAIDSSVLLKLEQHGLVPSPPADKRTILRRVFFDVTGLPPTPEDMDSFLADDAADAYERVVDRLLASPRYGERWARHWMDVVHFAETHGHDQDRPREHAWRYRDYLIHSFNADKPYARFVQEQVAGDTLFADDPWALVATGFLAAGPWDESSLRDIREDTLDREIARYLDRDDIVTTVMSTFSSSTVHCSRCHDHKFDPISQQQYYGLQAVFAATDKANRSFDADPQIAQRRRQLQEQKDALPKLREHADPALLAPELAEAIAAWEQRLAAAASHWTVLEPHELTSSEGAMLRKLDDGSIVSSGPRPEKDTYTVVAHTTLPQATAIRLEVLTDDSLPHRGPGRQDNGNLHLNELEVSAAPRLSSPAAQLHQQSDDATADDQPSAAEARKLELVNPRADFNQQGWSIDLALDGNPATAWGIYPEVGQPHQAVFALKEPLRSEAGVALTIRLQQIHGGGHLIGRFRLSLTAASDAAELDAPVVPQAVMTILSVPAEQRTAQQRVDVAAYFLGQKLDRDLAALSPQQFVYCGTNRFQAEGSFRPSPSPRAVHVLRRGDVKQPLVVVGPSALGCVPDLPAQLEIADAADEAARRAALARWLTDRRNVLTWRSIANRIWHYHFGRGIVDSPNDFGRMGAVPTHPELLDWLAAEMRDAECDSPPTATSSLKRLHRLIVTSAAYRQSSTGSAPAFQFAQSVDADNRYLWRMNRQRLDAESVRDAVLQMAGTLDSTIGGPSVKQFIETPGVHVTPNVDYLNFNVDDPALRRRSVYRFIFRTLPDPFMDSLDCPDASQLTPKRNTSLTALQALAMLNDRFLVRQSERLAERIESSSDSSQARASLAFRLIFGRELTDREFEAVATYAASHGWANACRFLLNTNEFLFVD